jgi:hypothetical protein
MSEETVEVSRKTLAILADEANVRADSSDYNELFEALSQAYMALDYTGDVSPDAIAKETQKLGYSGRDRWRGR